MIKRWGETKGYRATVEKPILDGLGSVDVALEKEGSSVACEISVTSTVEQEVGNIQKCLVAGFEHVVLVSSDKKVLSETREAMVTLLSTDQMKRVRYLSPEQLFAFIESLAVKAASRQDALGGSGADELLTAKELEALLRIDVKTIYSYVQKGLIPYMKVQSNLRFLKSEILNWMAERQFRPKPPASRR